MKIGVGCSFDAAHRLMNHNGKCKNLHGHRYRVVFEFESSEPAPEMVIDFGIIKSAIRDHLDRFYDHATLVNGFDADLNGYLIATNLRRLTFSSDPTAEVIARVLFHGFGDIYVLPYNVSLVKVRVYETPTNYAEVTA